MKGILAALLLAAAGYAPAAAQQYGTVPVQVTPVVLSPVELTPVELATLSLTPVQVAALRLEPVAIQAVVVSDMLARWGKLYGILDGATGLYRGNHFAAEAVAIRAQATKEGVTDAVLAELADFAARLKQATGK